MKVYIVIHVNYRTKSKQSFDLSLMLNFLDVYTLPLNLVVILSVKLCASSCYLYELRI